MKRLIIIPVLALVVFPLFGFGADEGEYISKTYTLDGFTAIDNRTSMDVYVRVGGSSSIEAEAYADFLEKVEIEVDDGELKITRPGIFTGIFGGKTGPKANNLYVTMPELHGITLTGSGDLEVQDDIQSNDLPIRLTGSGDIRLTAIETEELELKLTGSGEVVAGSVSANEISITLTGSGDTAMEKIDTRSLKIKQTGSGDFVTAGNADTAEVTLTGSGSFYNKELTVREADITISASGNGELTVPNGSPVRIKVTGSGDFTFYGSPDFKRKTITGSGDVTIQE